jgi:pimeloyl-ACP methyl ester carboxylesterase
MRHKAIRHSNIPTNALRNLLIFAGLAIMPAGFASDSAKEQRWSEQIVDSLLVGDAVWLEAEGQRFLGIYTSDLSGKPKGAVILLHGMGVHPNWPDVIYPLRTQLPEYGWATLAIQMPVLSNDAKLADYAPLIPEAAPRIKAAASYLTEQGYDHIAVIGHSLGATMGSACLASDAPPGLMGLVTIGMGTSKLDAKLDNLSHLEKISVPVFDLYGSRDLDAVRDSATARAKAARSAGNTNYRQNEVEGADHFFVGLDDELVRRIRGWLDHLLDSTTQPTP